MKFRLLLEFVTQTTNSKNPNFLSFNPFKIGGEGVKNENSSPLDQTQPNFVYILHILAFHVAYKKKEKSQPKHSVKKQAKFERVVKSSVRPS